MYKDIISEKYIIRLLEGEHKVSDFDYEMDEMLQDDWDWDKNEGNKGNSPCWSVL